MSEPLPNPTAPTVYTVRITHDWKCGVSAEFLDVGDSPEDKHSIAFALRKVADQIEAGLAAEDDGKVVGIHGGKAPVKGEPQRDLVHALADTFERARSGELRVARVTGNIEGG